MVLRARVLELVIAAALLGQIGIGRVYSHEESGQWHCDSDSGTRIQVGFRPGIITLDGHVDDWKNVDGWDFSLLPALDHDDDKEYNDGKMTLKAVHDGKEAYFMLQVNGNYAYTKGDNNNCPSVALMFQIGENASYHRMGGCEEGPDSCTNKTCHGHEVDIMHFSIGNAIPGRLYGRNPVDNGEGNGGDRFGHLVDVYAWNPHCRFLDGLSPSGNDTSAQNDWQGSWGHSILTDHSGFIEDDCPYASEGHKGTYYFEFSRPMRTMDRAQQDAQFTIGKSSKFSAAFWYPVDGKPWHGSGHYSITCDWIPLDFISSSSDHTKGLKAMALLNLQPFFSVHYFPSPKINSSSRITCFCTQSKSIEATAGNSKQEYKPGVFDDIFLHVFRSKMAQEIGWDSEKPGYDGLIDVAHRIMNGRSNSEAAEAAVRILRSLFPPLLLELYKMLISPIAGGKVAALMVARVTALSCQWLMGPCTVNSVDLPNKSSWSSGVFVEKCKYLEESKCVGVCINTCKLPTQTFFKEYMGVPLTMEPNFSDYSCQFNFGVLPPPPEDESALKEPCLEICPTASLRRKLSSAKDVLKCPKV